MIGGSQIQYKYDAAGALTLCPPPKCEDASQQWASAVMHLPSATMMDHLH